MIAVNLCLPRSIRIKLNTRCQYNCRFCHQEGDAKTSEIKTDELLKALKLLKKGLGFYRLHFTGGEPTLYKEFAALLTNTKKLGFINALTTNGQFTSFLRI
ncbi:MAG: radical SAM protein, partial [Patescibacteria group bacterium]